MYGSVYIIHNLVNGKYYVGQTTKRLRERLWSHISAKPNMAISRAIKKYGRDNFIIELLAEADTQDQLDLLEVLWIIALRSYVPFGYNLRIEAVGRAWMTPESLFRIGAGNRGREKPTGEKDKISAGLKRYYAENPHPNSSRVWKEESKNKLRALIGPRSSMYGRHHTEESKAKSRASNLGVKRSQAVRDKNRHWARITKNGRGKRSAETKLHMRMLRAMRRIPTGLLILQHGTGNYF